MRRILNFSERLGIAASINDFPFNFLLNIVPLKVWFGRKCVGLAHLDRVSLMIISFTIPIYYCAIYSGGLLFGPKILQRKEYQDVVCRKLLDTYPE